MTKKYVITKEKMQEGIKICFNKACLLIDSAESLLKHRQSPDVVIGLITIALEEFGKGLLLKDYLNCDKSEYEIPIELFKTPKSHFKKINRGLEEIPTEHRYIYPPLLIKLFSHSDIKIIINGNRMNVSIPKNLEKQFKNFDTNEVTFLSKYTPKIKNHENGIANFPNRMLCFYVNWNDEEKNWETGVETSDKRLQKLTNAVKQKILKYHICDT